MKAQWTEGRYGVYYLVISNNLRVCVAYDSGATMPKGTAPAVDGYKITFLGHTMKGRPRNIEKAKVMAVQFAAIVLNNALEAIQ